jgi:hypothetical protein
VTGRGVAALAVGVALAGCAGVLQRPVPGEAMAWRAVTAVGGPVCVGSAERDVTPPIGAWLAGYDPARAATQVAEPLKVRVLVVAAAGRRIAIVGVDNLGFLREDVDWLKQGIAGFALGDVFVCASHTHAGPDAIGLWGRLLLTSGRDPAYLGTVREATAAAVAEALAGAVPATLAHGEALLPAEGLVQNVNRRGVFDRRLTVLHARAVADGRPVGTLLHLACHPEVRPRSDASLSADFVGPLCDGWRARGHGQAVFVNGAIGALVSPAVRPRDASGVAAFGARACAVAEAALRAAEPLPVDAIDVARADVYLPLRTTGFRLGRLTTVLPREAHGGAARSTVGWLRLGAFEAVAVPGEIEPVFAEELRVALRKPRLVVFGLCDDEVGYLLRGVDAVDPGFAYERSMSACRDAGERVRAALVGVSAAAGKAPR